MFAIWAKLMKDGKILKQVTYRRDDKFSYSQLDRKSVV